MVRFTPIFKPFKVKGHLEGESPTTQPQELGTYVLTMVTVLTTCESWDGPSIRRGPPCRCTLFFCPAENLSNEKRAPGWIGLTYGMNFPTQLYRDELS